MCFLRRGNDAEAKLQNCYNKKTCTFGDKIVILSQLKDETTDFRQNLMNIDYG